MATPGPLGVNLAPPLVTSMTEELLLSYPSINPVSAWVRVLRDFTGGTNSKSPLSLVKFGKVVTPAELTISCPALVTVIDLATALAAWYCPFPACVAVMVAVLLPLL